jgi:solute carrier family 35 protein
MWCFISETSWGCGIPRFTVALADASAWLQVYLKHICNTVKLDNWSKVYYSNFLAAIPLVFIGAGTSEFEVVTEQMTAAGLAALLLSVALGAAMSYFAWAARSTISATSFTIVGNTCKILTIAINVFLWDKHASVTGIMCLLACLAAAFFYKQAPPRMDVRHTLPQHH